MLDATTEIKCTWNLLEKVSNSMNFKGLHYVEP